MIEKHQKDAQKRGVKPIFTHKTDLKMTTEQKKALQTLEAIKFARTQVVESIKRGNEMAVEHAEGNGATAREIEILKSTAEIRENASVIGFDTAAKIIKDLFYV